MNKIKTLFRSISELIGHFFGSRWLLFLPLILLIVFFLIPVLQMLLYSFFHYHPTKLIIREFTLSNYIEFISDTYLISTLIRTIRLALYATIVCAILGYIVAYRMWEAGGLEKMVLALAVLLPLMVSPIVLAFSWIVMLAPNTGFIPNTFVSLGITPPRILYTELGVIIGLVHVNLVFMVLSVHASLENIDRALLRAGEISGANARQVFMKITLPLSLPGVVSGSLLVFGISSSSFLMPLLLGGRTTPVLATYAYEMATVVLNWPSASTVSAVLVLTTSIVIVAYTTWTQSLERRMGK